MMLLSAWVGPYGQRVATSPLDDLANVDPATWLIFGAGTFVVGFAVVILILRSFLFICQPNEILVFSGRKHTLPDGTQSGYKILHGGRGLRMPFLESVSRMDMRLFAVEVAVQNAYSKGGIPLSVHAIANMKIASTRRRRPQRRRALPRRAGRSRSRSSRSRRSRACCARSSASSRPRR